MHLTSIIGMALLPLLAVAEPITQTSTTVLYKTVTIQKAVATSTFTSSNTTSLYLPTGTGVLSTVLPTTTSAGSTSTAADESSQTASAPTVSPTINNSGVSLGATKVVLAGVAGVVIAILM